MLRSRHARNWFARAAVVGLAVVGVQIAATDIASAHANTVSGVAACASDGSYTVTWTLLNDWNTTDTVTVNSSEPSAATLAPTTLTLGATGSGSDTGQMVQSRIPAGTKTATLDVKGYWADDNTTIASTVGSVDLTGTCPPPPPSKHTATAPQYANGACVAGVVTQPTITIPSDSGVVYTLDALSTSAGTRTVTAGVAHHITALSTAFTLTGDTSWTYTPTAAPGSCTVTPVSPTLSQSACNGSTASTPTLTLASTPGITYTVSAGAPYRQGQKVVVSATALHGLAWRSPLPNGWHAVSSTLAQSTITFADAACTVGTTAVTPSFTSAVCTGGSTPTAGSYTIPVTKGVQYQVNGKPVSAGTATAAWGSTVTVVAVATKGYSLQGRTVWHRAYPTQQHCAELAGVTSSRTPDSGSASPVAASTAPTLAATGAPTGTLLVVGFAAIVLGSLLTRLASRRRRDELA